MKPRRIALVSEHASPLASLGGADAGGQNVHVAALASELARAGCEVAVYTRRDSTSLPPVVTLDDGVSVVHVHAGPPRPVPKDRLLPYMPAFSQFLHRSWVHDRPDIVHSHFWMSGWASLEPALVLRIPIVHTYHALGRVKRRYQPTTDTSPAQREGIEGYIARRATGIIATCEDEVAELRAMGADPNHVHVVPCGVDTDVFSPSRSRSNRHRHGLRVVSLGRLVPRKGVDDVVRALARVPEATLLVAGGPEASKMDRDVEVRRLRGIATAVGVADRVTFLGSMPRASVPALLRSADVVACTPWYEPFGIVPLEAAASGVPVIGTAVGGLLDTIVDGQTGVLVPPRQPGAVGAALRRMVDDPELRRSFGQHALARVRSRYTWRRVATATLHVYEKCLAQRIEAVPA